MLTDALFPLKPVVNVCECAPFSLTLMFALLEAVTCVSLNL